MTNIINFRVTLYFENDMEIELRGFETADEAKADFEKNSHNFNNVRYAILTSFSLKSETKELEYLKDCGPKNL